MPARKAETKGFGFHYLIKNLLKSDPLLSSIQETFPDRWDEIMAIAEFMVSELDAKMCDFDYFSRNHDTYCDHSLTPSSITKLLQSIDNDAILKFFFKYIDKLEKGAFYNKERFWALDSTSFGSYSRNLSDAQWGRPKQEESLPQLNVMMLVDQDSGRPIYYQHFNGSIPDVSTVKTMCAKALQLGARSFVLVFDRGYYGKDNLNEIFETGYHFVTCVPISKTVQFDPEIAEAAQQFLRGKHFDPYCGQRCIRLTKQFDVGQGKTKTVYVHVFFDDEKAAAANTELMNRREEVIKMKKSKAQLSPANEHFASKYLIEKDDGSFEHNDEAYDDFIRRAGYWVIVSDVIKHTHVAYNAYKARGTVEEVFSTMKTRMKINRMRVSTDSSLDGKCFIQFIAVSIWMLLEYVVDAKREKGELKSGISMSDIIKELKSIKRISFDNQCDVFTDASKMQKAILGMFGLSMPSNGYKDGVPLANKVMVAKKPHGYKRT